MDVEPIPGEAFRLYVQSSSRRGIKFLVDLDEFDFNGMCSCEDFSLRRVVEVRDGKKSECKHIRIAKDWWAEMMMRRIKQQLQRQWEQQQSSHQSPF